MKNIIANLEKVVVVEGGMVVVVLEPRIGVEVQERQVWRMVRI